MKRLADPVLVRGRQDANRLSKAQNRYRPEVKWICVEKPLPELDVRCQQMVWGWVDAQADQRYDDPPNGLIQVSGLDLDDKRHLLVAPWVRVDCELRHRLTPLQAGELITQEPATLAERIEGGEHLPSVRAFRTLARLRLVQVACKQAFSGSGQIDREPLQAHQEVLVDG